MQSRSSACFGRLTWTLGRAFQKPVFFLGLNSDSLIRVEGTGFLPLQVFVFEGVKAFFAGATPC